MEKGLSWTALEMRSLQERQNVSSSTSALASELGMIDTNVTLACEDVQQEKQQIFNVLCPGLK